MIASAATAAPVVIDANENIEFEIPGLELLSESLSNTFSVPQELEGLELQLKKDMALYETKANGYRLRLWRESPANPDGKKILKAEDPLIFWLAQVAYLLIFLVR